MKWLALPAVLAVCASPAFAGGQRHSRRYVSSALITLPIGRIAQVDDRSPKEWGMSGMKMLEIKRGVGSESPLMRTETFDARTVEILSRTQAPPLRAHDIHVANTNGRDIIAVRHYFLMEVLPEDANAVHMGRGELAQQWATGIRRVLPLVAPMPSRFGV